MEQRKPKIFAILKVLAVFMLIFGIVLIVLGTAVFPTMFNDHAVAPNAAFFAPGMILAFLSIPCAIIGFFPQITKTSIKAANYLQQDNKEDLKNFTSTSAEILEDGLTKASSAIKKGMKTAKFCKHCGKEIDVDSKFCQHCGKQQ